MSRVFKCVEVCIGVLALTSVAFAQECAEVFKDYRDATVYIHVERTTKLTGAVKEFNGTGTLVSPYGYVLTNYHVIEQPQDVDSVALTGAVGSSANPATRLLVVAQDPGQDLALLQIANSDQTFKFVSIDFASNPHEGIVLCSMGFPMEQDLSITKGILSNKIADRGWWLTDMAVNPGDSGAPVFDETTKVVAIVVGGISNAQNLNLIIPIVRARPILEYVQSGPAESTPLVNAKTRGQNLSVSLSANTANATSQGASTPTPKAPNSASSLGSPAIKKAVLFDGFRFFGQSTFEFQTGTVGPWGSELADIGVASPAGQSIASFFVYYNAPPYKNAKMSTPSRSGILETSAANLEDVAECPSSVYNFHYFQPQIGRVYCVRTHDGHHYAKIKVLAITDDQISFDYIYQPSGSRKFQD